MALVALGLGSVVPCRADNSEAAVKAAYLIKFLDFIEWPPGALGPPGAPQVIGVLGADAVLAELAPVLAGRHINGRPLVARRVVAGDSLDGLHVLHLGRSLRPALLLPALAGRPLLLVTDVPEGLPDLAMLNFVVVQRRVRFEAAPHAAERVGLRLSARLLGVAERVRQP